MIISSEDSDRGYVEEIFNQLENNPLYKYEMYVVEQKENGDYTHISIAIDRIDEKEEEYRR